MMELNNSLAHIHSALSEQIRSDIMQGNIYIYWSLEEGEGPGMLDGRGGGETNGDGEGRAVVVVMTTIGTNLSFTPWLLGQLSNKTHFQ